MPKLYIVATPIGNLEDITLRAVRILNEADLILAEDTRVTKKILERHNIKKPLLSYHQHSRLNRLEEIEGRLKKGENLALVSDAGTPGISDPGSELIRFLAEKVEDLKIIPIPGPTALIAALSISGFDSSNFVFLGFPPHKKGRQTFFKELVNINKTVVFYESPHRIIKALEELAAAIPERKIMAARELTKQFETIYRGTAQEVLNELKKIQIRGEFVVVVDKTDKKLLQ